MAAVGKSGLLDGLRFRQQQQKSADRERGGGEEFRSLVSASMLGTVDVEGGRSRVATEEEGGGEDGKSFSSSSPFSPLASIILLTFIRRWKRRGERP